MTSPQDSGPPPRGDTLFTVMSVFARHSRVVETFAPDENFLRGLLPDAQNLTQVRNSFRGIFRLNRFLEDLQKTLDVCLDPEDGKTEWTQQSLAAHVDRKKEDRAAQKTLAAKRYAEARQQLLDGMVKSVLFLSLPMGIFVCYAFAGGTGRWLGLLIAAAPALMVFWLCTKNVLLYRRLSARMAATGE